MNLRLSLENVRDKNFHALTHKNFRMFWLGQCVSLMGTWVQNIGLTWLVLSITGSPFLLGLLETVRFLPITLFSLISGVIIDRFPKRIIILITQMISMLMAFILSALVFTNLVRYEYILMIAVILGFTNTVYMPARQAFTIEITGKEDLVNANALSSITSNLARVAGPAIGAVVLAMMGSGWCFLLNGISFMAVIASLMIMEESQIQSNKITRSERNLRNEIKDGIHYIITENSIFEIIMLIAIMGIFAFNYDIIVPVFTKNILVQNEKIYGLLMSAMGIGSLIGAVLLSLKSKFAFNSRNMIMLALFESALIALISFTRNYYITAGILAATGMFNMWFTVGSNSALQLTLKDEYRGRVMSVYFLVYSGTAPIGYIFAGGIMDRLGASIAFLVCGMSAIILILLLRILFNRKDNKKSPASN